LKRWLVIWTSLLAYQPTAKGYCATFIFSVLFAPSVPYVSSLD
jgi:hypothetical protein